MTPRFFAKLPPIKINSDLLQAVQSLAQEREISVSQVVRDAIRLYISTHQKNANP
jgi:metal-responsive CopG/Arc/MetJ family transcriptional regulator